MTTPGGDPCGRVGAVTCVASTQALEETPGVHTGRRSSPGMVQEVERSLSLSTSTTSSRR